MAAIVGDSKVIYRR